MSQTDWQNLNCDPNHEECLLSRNAASSAEALAHEICKVCRATFRQMQDGADSTHTDNTTITGNLAGLTGMDETVEEIYQHALRRFQRQARRRPSMDDSTIDHRADGSSDPGTPDPSA